MLIICQTCRGSGNIRKRNQPGIEQCITCKGTGEVEADTFPEGYEDTVKHLQTNQDTQETGTLKTRL